jgi:acyl-CoA dehydrogenase
MYSFEPSEEQQMLIDVANRYAVNELRPAAHEAEEEGLFADDLIQKGWELGLLQASVPEEYGGLGEHSALTTALAAEELAYGDLAGAVAIMLPALFASPIILQGSDEQKQQFLPAIVENTWQPYTAAFIEPAVDFDPLGMATTATKKNGDYVLNGKKTFVPFASQAEHLLIYADIEGTTQAFIVLADSKGLEIGERQKTLGVHALSFNEIGLMDVKVPANNRLGGPDGHSFAPILDSMRIAISILGVGVARASYEYSRDYAKEREVFGTKVAQKQSIAFMLAEMATEIEAIRLLSWEAAYQIDNGEEESRRTAYFAETGAADMAMMVTDRGVQVLGGHGYIREHPVELWMRNGRGIASLTGLAMF